MTAATTLVRAHALVRRFGSGDTAVEALRGVDLDLRPAQFTAIVGPSGSGKSTLMHCLAGLDRPTSGDVENRRPLPRRALRPGAHELRRQRIGFIFQSFNLLPVLSARENVELAAHPRRHGRRRRLDRRTHRRRRPHRPPVAPPRRALPAASRARGGCSRARDPTGGRLRRRADRQPRFALVDGDPRPARRAVDEYGQTLVMVTHDPRAAARADGSSRSPTDGSCTTDRSQRADRTPCSTS